MLWYGYGTDMKLLIFLFPNHMKPTLEFERKDSKAVILFLKSMEELILLLLLYL